MRFFSSKMRVASRRHARLASLEGGKACKQDQTGRALSAS